MKLKPELRLIRALQFCAELLAQHPDLRASNKVTRAIGSLCENNHRHAPARRKRRLNSPAYQPGKRLKHRNDVSNSHRARQARLTSVQGTSYQTSRGPPIHNHETSHDDSNIRQNEPLHNATTSAMETSTTEEQALPHALGASDTNTTSAMESSSEAFETGQDDLCDYHITVPVAIDIIEKLSQELHETPRHVYAEVLQLVQGDVEGSSDSVWRAIIRDSFFRDQKKTIFNLLEYIGASEWFDRQVSITQDSCRTKKGQPIQATTAAGKVVDSIWERSNMYPDHICGKTEKAQRKRIWLQLHRGRRLREKIIKRLGLGILFSPKIWEIVCAPSKKLDRIIEFILTDSEQEKLLKLLDEQVECLVRTMSTNLELFCNGLKEQELEDLSINKPIDEENAVVTQTNPVSLSDGAPSQNQTLQMVEPNFRVFRDTNTTSVIGFEFENVCITSEEISDVKENVTTIKESITAVQANIPYVKRKTHWLTASHIRLFCLYLEVSLSRGDRSGKIYFFCPLTISAFKKGWNSILESEGPQSDKNYILSAHYLAFPIVTDENDHWFMVIVPTPCVLADLETPTAFILDPSWFDWKKKLYQPIKRIITKVIGGSTAAKRGTIQLYEATEGTLPQQSEDLCGYYLMLYLELLATAPDALLTRVRDFNTAITRMDYMFEPGKMDGDLAERFAGLFEVFEHAEQRMGRLVTNSGRFVFEGDLTCLARGLNLGSRLSGSAVSSPP